MVARSCSKIATRLKERSRIVIWVFLFKPHQDTSGCPATLNAGGSSICTPPPVATFSNDILAAIGRVQLEKLPGFIARRRQIWGHYQRELAGVSGLICPPEPLAGTTSSYYLYWIQLIRGRDELAVFLAEKGVYTTFRYYPLHLVRFFQAQCRLPVAEHINETTLNLPLHQNLSDDDVQMIIDLIKRFLNEFKSGLSTI